MANKEKTQTKEARQVPHTVKTVVSVVEVVARFLAAYLLLNNFEHIVAVAGAWYFLITAVMAVLTFIHMAFKK